MVKEGPPGLGPEGTITSGEIGQSSEQGAAPTSITNTSTIESEPTTHPDQNTVTIKIDDLEGVILESDSSTIASAEQLAPVVLAQGVDYSAQSEAYSPESVSTTPTLEFREEDQPVEEIQEELLPEKKHVVDEQSLREQARALEEAKKQNEWHAFVNFAHTLFQEEYQQLMTLLSFVESKINHAIAEAKSAKQPEDPSLPGQGMISKAALAANSIKDSLLQREDDWRQRWAHMNFGISKIVLDKALRQAEAAISQIKSYIYRPLRQEN